MFRFSRSSLSSSSSSGLRFIVPPGDLPESRVQFLLRQRKTLKSGKPTAISTQALRACGITQSEKLPESNNNKASLDTRETKQARGKLNAADLTDEELDVCLATLPRYVDLATARLSHAGSSRAFARHNHGSPLAVHRNAILNLKNYIYKTGLCDDLPGLERMELSELYRRFGHTKEVKRFLTIWRDSFVIDADQLSG